MPEGIISNTNTISFINSSVSHAISSSISVFHEQEMDVRRLKARIDECLRQAIAERQRREEVLKAAQAEQEALASAGGETPFSVVTMGVSLIMTPEIVALEGWVAEAAIREEKIKNIHDDFESRINPLLDIQKQHARELEHIGRRSSEYLCTLKSFLDESARATQFSGQTSAISGGKTSADINDIPSYTPPQEGGRNALTNSVQDGPKLIKPSGRLSSNDDMWASASNSQCSSSEVLSGTLETNSIVSNDGSTTIVSGMSDTTIDNLLPQQGQNSRNYKNDCALVTVANFNRAIGNLLIETEVVEVAAINNLCRTDRVVPEYNGGATDSQVVSLLSYYGISSHIEPAQSLSHEKLSSMICKGHIVTIGVDANALWGGPPLGRADHQILITKVHLDSNSKVLGYSIVDTGANRSDGNKIYVSRAQLDSCFFVGGGFFGYVAGATAIVSNQPLLKPPAK